MNAWMVFFGLLLLILSLNWVWGVRKLFSGELNFDEGMTHGNVLWLLAAVLLACWIAYIHWVWRDVNWQ
jgi:hypothetical protein